jgi:DNA-binding protein YbaB
MTNPMHDRIEQAMADLERHKTAVAGLRSNLSGDSTTIAPKNRSISVTVDGHGELTEVRFPSNAYRSMAPAELGRLIVETVAEARTEAKSKTMAAFQSVLPQGMPLLDMLRRPVDLDEVRDEISNVFREAEETRISEDRR